MPKRDVKNRVALKAVLRPIRSEPNDVNPVHWSKINENTYRSPNQLRQSSYRQTLKRIRYQYGCQELQTVQGIRCMRVNAEIR